MYEVLYTFELYVLERYTASFIFGNCKLEYLSEAN